MLCGRKEGGEDGQGGQRQGQEFNSLDLETTTQTFMLRGRPSPLCVSSSVKNSQRRKVCPGQGHVGTRSNSEETLSFFECQRTS